jgi:hypothetical protein
VEVQAIPPGQRLDVLLKLEVEKYKGQNKVSAQILDFRPSEASS